MSHLVLAVLWMCISESPTQCEQKTIKVETKACGLPSILGETPMNGKWTRVRIGVRCQ